MFYSFGRPLKDRITEQTEKATGGTSIGERKWTERVKLMEPDTAERALVWNISKRTHNC